MTKEISPFVTKQSMKEIVFDQAAWTWLTNFRIIISINPMGGELSI